MARSPPDRLRKLCLAQPDAWEKVFHGEPTFWAGKRMFASFADASNHHGAGRDAVWCRCDHTSQAMLVGRAPDLYFVPPYVGPSGWIGVYLDGRPDWRGVEDRIAHAYDLALAASRPAPRARRR